MAFWIGACRCRLSLLWAASLKDRRQVVRSLTDGVRSKFNISVSDLGLNGSYQDVTMGFIAAGSSAAEIEERLGCLEKYLEQCETAGEFEISEITREVFTYGDISD